jgi:mannitol-1-phosphate 5-dehydrogenase
VSNEGYEDVWVENVTAVDGKNPEAVAKTIAECDIMATAVGVRVLPWIVPNIVAGLRKRWAEGQKPLNIIICENLMNANHVLEGMIKEQLTKEEAALFDQTVGLVEASIGRMVPVQTEEMKDGNPLRVCVEKYGFLPVDKAAFKGEIPEIANLVPYSPFDFYLKRKLYIHNMGHATCAYLGDILGLEYICQSIDVADVYILVKNAMLESAQALAAQYDAPITPLMNHIDDLLGRFTNAALGDTCQRVGGDPARKLSPEDRLIGAGKLALQQGITPCYIALGAAAGVHRYLEENGREQTVENAADVLVQVSGLNDKETLAQMILELYTLISGGASIADLRKAVGQIKSESMKNTI